MKKIYIDFETYSEAPLKTVGLVNYVMHPSFDVLCMAYAVDDEIVRLWTPNKKFPPSLKRVLTDDDYEIYAWNAEFEFVVWNRHCRQNLKWPKVHNWRCLQALSQAQGFASQLDLTSKVLLPKNKRKLSSGKDLIRKLCMPRKPTKADPVTRHTPDTAPDDFAEFYKYCRQDVDTARSLHRVFPRPSLSKREQRVWTETLKSNIRGVNVDVEFATKMIKLVENEKLYNNKLLKKITGGEVEKASQIQRIVKWIQSVQPKLKISSLTAFDVNDLLTSNKPDEPVRTVLRIRQDTGLSSLAKYDAIVKRSYRGKLFHLIWYHYASTGRFTSTGVQIHNLPRNSLNRQKQATVMSIIKSDEISLDEKQSRIIEVAGTVSKVAKALIRPCFYADREFCVVDYASIEFCLMIWLAGDYQAVAKWKKKTDFYKLMAAKIYKVAVEDVTISQRWIGKQVVLGCQYGMSTHRFKAFCIQSGVEMTEQLAKRSVSEYRSQFAKIAKYWNSALMEGVNAINNPGQECVGANITCIMKRGHLHVLLKSGRLLTYPFATVTRDKFGYGCISYKKSLGNVWVDSFLTGPRFTENIIQALARDVLVDGVLRLIDLGAKIMFHVHDEIVATNIDLATAEKCLTQVDGWYKDVGVRVEGKMVKRYQKI